MQKQKCQDTYHKGAEHISEGRLQGPGFWFCSSLMVIARGHGDSRGPLDWLGQSAAEDAAYRAGVLSLTKLKNPRTAAENQEDSKSSM